MHQFHYSYCRVPRPFVTPATAFCPARLISQARKNGFNARAVVLKSTAERLRKYEGYLRSNLAKRVPMRVRNCTACVFFSFLYRNCCFILMLKGGQEPTLLLEVLSECSVCTRTFLFHVSSGPRR